MATNEFLKDTAKALVFASGMAFDGFAFDESEISEEEAQQICAEIQRFCESGIKRLEKKYNTNIPITSTEDIINAILFE